MRKPSLSARVLAPITFVTIIFFAVSILFLSLVSIHNEIHNCRQTELLKDRVRMRARQDFNNLDANAKLLGIKVTPQLRQKAKEARNQTLSDYAPQACGGYFG